MESSAYFRLIFSQVASLYDSSSIYLTTKGFISLVAISGAALFGVQNYQFLGLLGLLVVIDMITGVMASIKLKKSISSRRALKTVTKSVIYLLFFSVTYLMGSIVPDIEFFIVNGVLAFLVITESLSGMENIAKMGYSIPRRLLNQLNNFESQGAYGDKLQ